VPIDPHENEAAERCQKKGGGHANLAETRRLRPLSEGQGYKRSNVRETSGLEGKKGGVWRSSPSGDVLLPEEGKFGREIKSKKKVPGGRDKGSAKLLEKKR